MNLKKAIKYQLWETRKPLIIFYSIVFILLICLSVTLNIQMNDGSNGSMGGFDSASMIFIFIAGMNSFKETFKMFLQNGLSRKTLFKSFAISVVIISIFMAFVDRIIAMIAKLITVYETAYIAFYGQRYVGNAIGILPILEGFLWSIFAYAVLAMIGFFITTLYYRMNKAMKLIVSIGVPVMVFVILPIIDTYFTYGAIARGISDFFAFAWGYKNGYNPYYSMITCTLFFILFGGLSYLLIHKAVGKE